MYVGKFCILPLYVRKRVRVSLSHRSSGKIHRISNSKSSKSGFLKSQNQIFRKRFLKSPMKIVKKNDNLQNQNICTQQQNELPYKCLIVNCLHFTL